jgi:beta-phosphoglucomutase-like phosphatase (HAD superfamily)
MSQATASAPDADFSSRAILVEMDTVALDGRKIGYDVMQSLLAEKGIVLTPMLFARHGLHPPVRRFLPDLLKAAGKTRLSEDKLAAEITEGIGHCLLDAATRVPAGVAALLEAAAKTRVRLGALSFQSPETAASLADRLGFKAAGAQVQTVPAPDASDTPETDAWRALGASLGICATSCVALASSRTTCLGALAAGMACIVIPDPYTGFEDVTGADLVLDKLDAGAVRTVCAFLAERP